MTTLGVLKADEVDLDNQSRYGTYDHMYLRLFQLAGMMPDQVRIYDLANNKFPSSKYDCRAYVITGSRFGVYDNTPWMGRLFEFVRTLHAARSTLLGVCFGHQCIAEALGGKVVRSPKGWGAGIHEYDVVHPEVSTWLNRTSVRLICSHQDQVIEMPPAGQRILTSEFCENAGMLIGNHILTVQGHPEFSVEYAEHLCNERAAEIGATYELAIQSLSMQPDNHIVAQLFSGFLYGKIGKPIKRAG